VVSTCGHIFRFSQHWSVRFLREYCRCSQNAGPRDHGTVLSLALVVSPFFNLLKEGLVCRRGIQAWFYSWWFQLVGGYSCLPSKPSRLWAIRDESRRFGTRKNISTRLERMSVEFSNLTHSMKQRTSTIKQRRAHVRYVKKRGNQCTFSWLGLRRNEESAVWFYALTNPGSGYSRHLYVRLKTDRYLKKKSVPCQGQCVFV
jgi:hypothetical protein